MKLKMALTIILSCGVIFLVLSLVGTCGANMKNEILLSLYTITMSILWTCEIVVTFRSVSKFHSEDRKGGLLGNSLEPTIVFHSLQAVGQHFKSFEASL